MNAPYDWAQVPPLGKAPRLNPTLVLTTSPQQLADQLDGLRISGGIVLDKRTTEDAYAKAHRLLAETITALMALEADHTGAREVADAVTDALNLFEDTVRDRPVFGDVLEVQFVDTVREMADKEAFKELHFGGAA